MQKVNYLVLVGGFLLGGLILGVVGCGGPSAAELEYKKAEMTPRPEALRNTPENMAKWATPTHGESSTMALKHHFMNRNN